MARIHGLFKGIRTTADVTARYGPPDEEREAGAASSEREKGETPARGVVYRTMIFKNLSPVANVVFYVGAGESVQGGWIGKYLGGKKSQES